MIVEVEVPDELMDTINSFSEGNEKTVGEVIVKIVESKFERDNFDKRVFTGRNFLVP